MAVRWTWWDSGTRPGAANCHLDSLAWAGSVDCASLRFYRFRPSVIVGAHEDCAYVARLDYCYQHGIDIARRLTGGGALYLDEQQLCWTLAMPSAEARAAGQTLPAVLERFCQAIAAAVRDLGVPASFQAFNDIEVDGRKIACGFVSDDGQRTLFQGSLLIDVDVETMLRALRVPTEKLSAEGMRTARGRFTSMREHLEQVPDAQEIGARIAGALGAALGVDIRHASGMAPPEQRDSAACAAVMPATAAGERFRAFHRTPGGVLHAAVALEGDGARFADVYLSGSIQLAPPDLFRRIGRALAGRPVEDLEEQLALCLRETGWAMVGATEADLGYVIALAANRRREQAELGVGTAAANMLMIHSPGHDEGLGDILAQATVMLVPYCAKPLWCKWRNRDGCTECGLCEVGEAYRLARERGMRVVSINNYEHLRQTLADLRGMGTAAYVGMCCENFYLKRHVAFNEAGIPAVLMDIGGSNCYELRQEDLAYSGTFQAQSRLNIELVRKVTALIPATRTGKS